LAAANAKIRNRIGKLDLATPHRVLKQDSREHLRHGTDLEHTLGIKRECLGTGIAMSEHAPSPSFIQQANDDASDPVVADKLLEHCLDR
jgi:hypothetical protein